MSNNPDNPTTNMTLDEQRAWVAEQLDAAVEASGVAEGWFDIYWHDVFWSADRPEDREMILNSLFPDDCGMGGQLITSLKNQTADDPLGAAARVRGFWESEGWTVSDVRSYGGNPYFRADREDGAVLAFQASPEGMSMSVESACSVNNTVTNWDAYLDPVPNEFEQELERRGESAEETQRNGG
ncbi:hypothetical protein [Leucobacter massiliensis]|uniref:Uncharacterized protein n=1 Tax=Leucobacter massiliensis TaxID=1686285 RepID=A0A2S9QLU3_9MICO|nr:hypothetical protein [Leucobacter massiliensis]PRI10569.1 hypothetical protein B4915_11260 [Leucobacter massiliensis]